MDALDVLQRFPDDDGVFYDDERGNEEDEECFSSPHLSGSEGNTAAASASSGSAGGNVNVEDIEIFPIQCWYHGRLNRVSAEKLISETGLVPGSYLVRQSDRRPRNYVLTFVSSSKSILHFQINSVCGHYFISQLEFASLSDLVRYFSLNAVIGGSERLVNPVTPVIPVELAKRKVVTLVPFCSMKDTDELSFTKGDILVVHEDFGNGWMWATSETTKESGLVYSGLTEDLAACNHTPEKLLYVHSHLSRQDAVSLLGKGGPGGYLVTPSESSPGNYTLLVNCGRRVERFQIRKHATGFEIGGRFFDGLHDVISRYTQVSICGDTHLTTPVPKVSDTLDNSNIDRDLYQKLRSNRLDSKSSCPDAIKSGYLNYKSRKRWKSMYVSLKDIDGQLYCYENEKRTKPKIVLDLFCCSLFLVHRSLFDRPHCFQLLQTGFNTALYFNASSVAEYEDWISLLRPLCCGSGQCPSPFSSVRNSCAEPVKSQLRRLNCLTIRVDKARFLPAKGNPELVAVISLNEAKVCRTSAVACDGSVVWDEKFIFDDLPHEVDSITVTITTRTKRAREVNLGWFKISVVSDEDADFVVDDWFDVTTTGPSWRQTNASQCHVMVNYCKEVILPPEEYRSLADLIRTDNFALCHYICIGCVEDRQKLAEALLSYYESDAMLLVISELKREIETIDDVRMLFRSGSLAVALMDELMVREGHSYATSVLRSAIEGLVTSKVILEIDQSKRSDKSNSSSSNISLLLTFAAGVCDRIFESSNCFPTLLRRVLSKLKECVLQKWPADGLIGLRAVSSFVFLRLFCLILVLPRQYHLLSEDSSPSCYRNLLLVAKVLQGVANFSDVSAKRECDVVSEALAAFSTRVRPKMISFLNAVSEPDSDGLEKCFTSHRESDPARHLATIFHICQKHANQIRNCEAKHSPVKNLLSVLELLSCHEQRYVAGPTVTVV